MASHEDKALPELPGLPQHLLRTPDLTTLTVESRAHIRRIILQALDGVDNRDQWSVAVQQALQELGDCISQRGWLAGLRRARDARLKRTREEDASRTLDLQDQEKEREDDKGKAKGKLKENATENEQQVKRPTSEHGSSDNSTPAKLRQLRTLTSTHTFPAVPKPFARHLLLTIDGTRLSSDGHVSDVQEDIVDCTFTPNAFALPDPDTDDLEWTGYRMLYGLTEWDVSLYNHVAEDPIQIIGGSFRLSGARSKVQYDALCKVLRLSIYVFLSLVLEQQLFLNSHVQLHFPRPSPKVPSSKPSVPLVSSLPFLEKSAQQTDKHPPKREGSVATGLWSFFSKKTETLLNRAASVGPSLVRRGSLDLPLTRTAITEHPRSSVDESNQRTWKTSFTSGSPLRKPQDVNDFSKEHPFGMSLRQVESSIDLLSTTPRLAVPLPVVLEKLANREQQDPNRRLSGDEKAALWSILGWEGKETLAMGMIGIPGFVRQQGLSLLYSTHVPMPLVAPLPATPSGSNSSALTPSRFASCGNRRRWVTYRYYCRDGQRDETLGEMITRVCSTAEEICDKPGCQFRRGDHDMRWIHAGIRVVATVGLQCDFDDDDAVLVWESCVICGQESRKEQMLDGTYLCSFGKYLELLIYSPDLCVLSPSLCEHTTVPSRPWPAEDTPLPRMRFNIHRKFAFKARTVTFSLATVDDIFELRMPRLQIIRRRVQEKDNDRHDSAAPLDQVGQKSDDDRRALRKEIMGWWQRLSEHMDELEENLVSDPHSTHTKALPRLPSEDDTYDMVDEAELATPKPSMFRLPSTASSAPTITAAVHEPPASSHRVISADSEAHTESIISSKNSPSQEKNSLSLLSGLRHAFQREEQTLYAELLRTPTASLNDVRRSFLTAARGASKRLAAWETKHSSQLPKGLRQDGMHHTAEPEWWRAGCHAVPGGNIIVREDDWGSIIAFTLGSVDYRRELTSMSNNQSRPAVVLPPPAVTSVETRQSYFTTGSSFRKLLSGNKVQPDPDEDGIVWQEPETHSAVISRKEHPREPTSLMPFREVLRHKGSSEGSSTPTTSNLVAPGSPSAKASKDAPPSARAKPAVELSMQAVDGRISGTQETADKILHDVEANASTTNSWRSSASNTSTTNSGFVETHIRRGKTASIISTDSDATTENDSISSQHLPLPPPPLPPKESAESSTNSSESHSQIIVDAPPVGAPSSIAATLTSTLASAMRIMIKPGETQRSYAMIPHHGLLSADSHAIDERPHIKYDWTIGKRLKFSCTVYYAKQFDVLRRRCGIEDVFLRSLARSDNWAAEGGKSKSNFWKTSDDQFIIKTLVNAWNVADLQVLIEMGPSYFRYMDCTASRPSVLAKLLGFYTVEIRNLESGTTQAKADLLVMENLFYKQKISKTFDLKGIQGRKVKASNTTSKTLFDGEWIEDQRRALTLVRPYSKAVFQEAIKADCDYLARSNIMDYSLLLGINDEDKHIACGLVDTIGSYTFAKTLEYKAKQGLNAGKEVTVLPPQEYQERFVSALDDYFLACPDKWSRPPDDTRIPHECTQLPSVL